MELSDNRIENDGTKHVMRQLAAQTTVKYLGIATNQIGARLFLDSPDGRLRWFIKGHFA